MSLDQAALAYREEALDLLSEVEETLLELESAPEDADNLAKLFRAMHTIKGSGAMFGYEAISRFTHEVETVLDRVRSGLLPLTPELLSLTLTAKDHILSLLSAKDETPAVAAASDALIARFRACLGSPAEPGPGQGQAAPAPAENTGPRPETAAYWLRYRPAPDAFANGSNPLHLVVEVLELGSSRLALHAGGVPDLDGLDPEAVSCWWDVLVSTDADEAALRDVFLFVEDDSPVFIRRLAEVPMRVRDLEEFAGILAASEEEAPEAVADRLCAMIEERLAKRRAPAVETGLAKGPEKAEAKSLRVDAERLDKLVDLVGELVIIQSRLSQTAQNRDDPAIRAIAEELERVSGHMRDEALGIRMLPIGTMYASLKRLVRDLAPSLGKQAVFVGEGAETELDKNVIDRLKDPLVHILRNCVDHGIEPPEARAAAGKPAQGTIRLTAVHAGGDVVLTIADDGAGVDLARVRGKAVERGLLSPDEEAGEEKLLEMLFSPGFSTARTVSSVSGRGVGMDVVRKNIEGLRGTVRLKSRAGQGTTLTVRLPLTLAIIDGLQVRVGREFFIIPLDIVEACQERRVGGAMPAVDAIERRGHLIPCLSLRRLLGVPGNREGFERVIVSRVEGTEIGLAVDAVIGQRQAVIKALSDVYKAVSWISGTTVNGDGGISLILDVPQLYRFAQEASIGKSPGGTSGPCPPGAGGNGDTAAAV